MNVWLNRFIKVQEKIKITGKPHPTGNEIKNMADGCFKFVVKFELYEHIWNNICYCFMFGLAPFNLKTCNSYFTILLQVFIAHISEENTLFLIL